MTSILKVDSIQTSAGKPIVNATGSILQVVNYQFGSVLNLGDSRFPYDDTIPQISEGGEVMTLAITPTAATSKLIIDVLVNTSPTLSSEKMVVALFQDTTANAIACVSDEFYDSGYMVAIPLKYYASASSTSARTYKVRLGRTDSHSNPVTVNGYNGARKFGGVLATSITITEIAG
tara:strand:- start:9 stop:536 length:528 start_codon:yes stop_codon:yes gene_type:complete